MSIDREIENAIRESVREVGQPNSVADRLIAWLKAMSNSELSDTDKSQRLNLVYQAIDIKELDNNYED